MHNYDSEVWSHRYHVKLPLAEIKGHEKWNLTVVYDVSVLYNFG
jgi:hypothetical protein